MTNQNMTTTAPTKAEKLLEGLKQDALGKEWTPERSELVDIIDEVQDEKV